MANLAALKLFREMASAFRYWQVFFQQGWAETPSVRKQTHWRGNEPAAKHISVHVLNCILKNILLRFRPNGHRNMNNI